MMNRETTRAVARIDGASIRHAHSAAEVAECYPLMRQLRPKLTSEADFLERWKRQVESGYRLAAVWLHGKPVALAGYRITENLFHGRHLYVDDLVTDSETRSQGYGSVLLSHLQEEAAACGCARLVLDTGLANALAHRFYYRQGLFAEGLHFTSPPFEILSGPHSRMSADVPGPFPNAGFKLRR